MPSDRWPRIQMIQLEASRLRAEAQLTNDPDRIRVIGDEMQILCDSLIEIRREQIMDSMSKPKRRRWWQRKTNEKTS